MPKNGGQIVISIDWNPRNKHLAKLAETLCERRIPVTWVASDNIESATPEDEIAIAVPGQHSANLKSLLSTQINAITAQGKVVTTAALAGKSAPTQILRELGISIVRQLKEQPAKLPSGSGLYATPDPICLPARGWWLQRGLDFSIHKALKKATQTAQAIHLQVESDLVEVAQRTPIRHPGHWRLWGTTAT